MSLGVPDQKPAANGEPGLRLHNGKYHAEQNGAEANRTEGINHGRQS